MKVCPEAITNDELRMTNEEDPSIRNSKLGIRNSLAALSAEELISLAVLLVVYFVVMAAISAPSIVWMIEEATR